MIAIIKSPSRDLGLEMSFCYQRPQFFAQPDLLTCKKNRVIFSGKKKLESFRESETVLTRKLLGVCNVMLELSFFKA